MPIGNLTSQIFANIYLNELDRFVKHEVKPKAYLRYGDDFIMIDGDREKLIEMRQRVQKYLQGQLKLDLHGKNDILLKTNDGLKFLGVILYPSGCRISDRNKKRVFARLNPRNAGSYWGILKRYEKKKYLKRFQWRLMEKRFGF